MTIKAIDDHKCKCGGTIQKKGKRYRCPKCHRIYTLIDGKLKEGWG